MADTDLVLLD